MTIQTILHSKRSDQLFYVISDMPDLSYVKIGDDTIIGESDGFVKFFVKNVPSIDGMKAFSGREFNLHTDEGVVHCNGQWWSGQSDTAKEIYPPETLTEISVNSFDKLTNSYLFYGHTIQTSVLEQALDRYDGGVEDYVEYGKAIEELRKNKNNG